MPVLLIYYDYTLPSQAKVEKLLYQFSTHWHIQKSVWIVEARYSATQMRDMLKQVVDPNDEVLVVALSSDVAFLGYDQAASMWLTSIVGRSKLDNAQSP